MGKAVVETEIKTIGDSAGIVLPVEIANRLGLEAGDKILLIETDRGGFEIVPYSQRVEETLEVAKNIVQRYRNAFEELAK